MGYNTVFTGELKFTCEMTAPMLAELATLFGEDSEKALGVPRKDSGYVDLVFTKDFSGIRWDDGTEKTYNLTRTVTGVIHHMRKKWPAFGLSGSLNAQGEDSDDRWRLEIGDTGIAVSVKLAVTGTKVRCPECDHTFRVDLPAEGKTRE